MPQQIMNNNNNNDDDEESTTEISFTSRHSSLKAKASTDHRRKLDPSNIKRKS